MADNFKLFSEVVPALTAAERRWVQRVLADDADAKLLQGAGIDPNAVDLDDWPGFEWEINPGNGELWLYAQSCGNAAHAGELVRALLARFRPADCWHLTWAETCSKPRVSEFGGGALFVTARAVRTTRAHNWVERQRKAYARLSTRRKPR